MVAAAILLVLVTVSVLWAISRETRNCRAEKTLTVVITFSIVGFLMAWVLVAVYAVASHLHLNPSTTPLLVLCPPSIMSLGLDNASLLVGLFGWLVISVSNAALYALLGIVAGGVMFPLWKPKSAPTDN